MVVVVVVSHCLTAARPQTSSDFSLDRPSVLGQLDQQESYLISRVTERYESMPPFPRVQRHVWFPPDAVGGSPVGLGRLEGPRYRGPDFGEPECRVGSCTPHRFPSNLQVVI